MEKENIFEEAALEAKDIKELKSHLLIYLLVLAIIGALISGLIALLAPILPARNGESHIPEIRAAYMDEVFYIFLAGIAVFVLLGLWKGGSVFLDIFKKRKYKSQTFIAKKYVHKGINYFEFGTQPVKMLPTKQHLFNAFSESDKVVIKYTKFNAHILKL